MVICASYPRTAFVWVGTEYDAFLALALEQGSKLGNKASFRARMRSTEPESIKTATELGHDWAKACGRCI